MSCVMATTLKIKQTIEQFVELAKQMNVNSCNFCDLLKFFPLFSSFNFCKTTMSGHLTLSMSGFTVFHMTIQSDQSFKVKQKKITNVT